MEIYKKSQIVSSLSDEEKLSHQSKHLLLELYRCNREKLNDESFLRCILNRASWPESNYSAVDIFTCGQNMMPELASKYLIESLMAKEHSLRVIERNPPSAVSKQIRTAF